MKFRAVMICDFDNPISMAYSEVAIKSWEAIKNVEVERWQCYTPLTLEEDPFNLPWGGYSSASKYQDVKHKISSTEKACFTSMFHWWKHMADTGEQVIVLEHDAFVRHPAKLNNMIDNWKDWDVWCPGIAAECITMSQPFAKFLMREWEEFRKTIDAGPMAEIHTAMVKFSRSVVNPNKPISSFLWPTLTMDNRIGEIVKQDINMGEIKKLMKGHRGCQTAPVTQCYYPGKQTIEHHKDKGKINYKDATYNQMEILESLDYE